MYFFEVQLVSVIIIITRLPDRDRERSPTWRRSNLAIGDRGPNATVWVGGAGAGTVYASNIVGSTYSFSAVAIAGQLNVAGQTNGKYAIFLIGKDSTQPWVIYLLQSN
jgi:hypothetical protein